MINLLTSFTFIEKVIRQTFPLCLNYGFNSFIVDLCHKFTVRNMNEIPVFVQSSELSNRT